MLRVWFKRKPDSLFGELIELWAGGHCHVELEFSDGQCFSSREESPGPGFKHVSEMDMMAPDWDCVPIPCNKHQEKTVRDQADLIEAGGVLLVTPKYGWLKDFTAFLPIPILVENDHVWQCGETVTACIQCIGLLLGFAAQGLSPDRIYKELRKQVRAWERYQSGGKHQ